MASVNGGLSLRVLREFHGLCNHAYDAWMTHRTLFDDNPRVEELKADRCEPFFSRLSDITQAYALQQIAKLHDPAVQQGRVNLTVEYVIRFGGWDASTTAMLEGLKAKLETLATKIKPARNRTFSHNDLEAILDNQPLGAFDADADVQYFAGLKQFVEIVGGTMPSCPMDFSEMAQGDVFLFLKRLHHEQEDTGPTG